MECFGQLRYYLEFYPMMIDIIKTDSSGMKLNRLLHPTPEQLLEIDRFVLRSSHGSFFSTSKAFLLFEALSSHTPFYYLFQEGNEILGLVLVVTKWEEGVKKRFSMRNIIYGGPVFAERILLGHKELFVKKYVDCLGKDTSAIYSEIRNFADYSELQEAYSFSGAEFTPHLNFLIPLDSEEAVLSKFKSEKRRQIRKALKAGVEIIKASNIDEVMQFYSILVNIYSTRVGKPLASKEFFITFFKNNGLFLLLKFEGKIIGGAMIPVKGNDIVYDWYRGGDDLNFKKLYPSTVAAWAGIKFGLDEGFKVYDFMGAGHPDKEYGVRGFKQQFGGDLVNYGRFTKVHKSFLFGLGKAVIGIAGRMNSKRNT